MLHLFDGDVHAGKLAFAVCEVCSMGHVLKVSVYAKFNRSGVGTDLITTLVSAFPQLTWYTTWQQPSSATFWRRMAKDLAQPLVERGRCEHPHGTNQSLPDVVGPFAFASRR